MRSTPPSRRRYRAGKSCDLGGHSGNPLRRTALPFAGHGTSGVAWNCIGTETHCSTATMPNVTYLNQRDKTSGTVSGQQADTASSSDTPDAGERGRRASSPWQIPWKGWKDILLRTYQQINEDRLLAVAAGVVFYGLLALFPAISALVS